MVAAFVTSTGTGIGKTYLTAGLAKHFRELGREVEAYKPIISGFDPSAPEESDTGILLCALGRSVTSDEINRISPWRFAAPLSPYMAAHREGRQVDFAALVIHSKDMAKSSDVVLIEGVGGIMVPLDGHHTVLDWMMQISLPTILVVGSYLGTISHTLSALEVLGHYGIAVRAVVVDETTDSSVPFEETVAAIRQFVPRIDVVALPHLKNVTETHPAFRDVAKLL